MAEIFKIQRPLFTNAGVPMVLIYNKDRSISHEFPFTSVESLFNDGELKVYVEADSDVRGLEVIRKVEAQNW